MALSRSPPDSCRADLASMMPAPVRSRRALTSCAEMAVLNFGAPLGLVVGIERAPLARRGCRGLGAGAARGGRLVGREPGLLSLTAGALLRLLALALLLLALGALLG